MKLVELELSMEGLSKRSSIFKRIEDILGQDWGDIANSVARQTARSHQIIDRDQEEAALAKRLQDVTGLQNYAS